MHRSPDDPMPRSAQVPAFFRRIALQGWQKSDYFTFSSSYPVFRRWLIERLLARDKNILSIGCGSGELERDLIKLGRRVTGLDICFEMLQAAKRRGIKNVVQADAVQLPFAASSFDLLIFPESIGYFELDKVLPGVANVLKNKGRLLMTAYPKGFAADRNYRTFAVKELSDSLQRNGFNIAAQNLLTVTRSRITEVHAEEKAQVIFMLAGK